MLQTLKLQSGQNLSLSSGNYFIDSEIGKGGFGSVYKGVKDNRYFAIKVNRLWEMLPEDREEIKKRIKLEYEISHGIQSSHVVHAYSYDEINENPVLVMDFCPDGNLREKIGKPYNTEELNSLALQILQGISSLHFFNIIHRDIKPENILFNKDVALLTDFGIAANLKGRLTKTDIRGHALKVFATMTYSPPEQSQKSQSFKSTGPTTDIFSFGVILFELITQGSLPFGNLDEFKDDSKAIEDRKTEGKWDVDKLAACIGTGYWFKIIQRCLFPDPKIRFQTIDEIIALLDSNMDQETFIKQTVWKIQVVEGTDNGKEFNLTNLMKFKQKNMLTMGRMDAGDPFINDIGIREEGNKTFISSRHATFEYVKAENRPQWYLRDGQWYAIDGIPSWNPSRNGLYVNEIQIDKNGVLLKNNDVIRMGKSLLRFYGD
ncbi:MAG TPA: FHA domain-containing serine/threonine-protein kinase [Bacteroidales bacterium]|nr:FHA domain-containing serine/threonine-protein kinase [Bacteroidales bacterium]